MEQIFLMGVIKLLFEKNVMQTVPPSQNVFRHLNLILTFALDSNKCIESINVLPCYARFRIMKVWNFSISKFNTTIHIGTPLRYSKLRPGTLYLNGPSTQWGYLGTFDRYIYYKQLQIQHSKYSACIIQLDFQFSAVHFLHGW